MLINADVKGLEVVCCAYLSRDKVLMAEIRNGDDLHGDNQQKFGFPERRIAKIFVFRLIYGGTAYSYALDPDFNWISTSWKYWQRAIDAFYEKYEGVYRWHEFLVGVVSKKWKLVLPTGRTFPYSMVRVQNGEMIMPRTTILNYPVQGLGAEMVKLARVMAFNELMARDWEGDRPLLVSSVHDSLLVDSPKEHTDDVARLLTKSINTAPLEFERIFNESFDLPLLAEIKTGSNMGNMAEYANYNS